LIGEAMKKLVFARLISKEIVRLLFAKWKKIELIDYHTTVTVGGLSFHALNAGHVLGACMFWLDLGGRSVLYTGGVR